MKLPESILFVGAHCDDIELFAGGLLSSACRLGRRVGVLSFSDHRGVMAEVDAAESRREAKDNLAWLAQRTGADITDHSGAMLPACQGELQRRRGELYAAMEALRDDYELVVTHAPGDTNQDHAQVAAEATRVFKAHASVLGGEFPWDDVGRFRPDVVVALSPNDVEAKVRMVRNYRSQQRPGRPYLEADVVTGLARMRGSQIREDAAEAFEVVTRIVSRP